MTKVNVSLFLGVTLAAASVAGCAIDADSTHSESSDAVGTVSQAATGSNPIIDAEFYGEMPALPAGVSYTDLGVNSSTIYLARSDRRVEVRTRQLNPPLTNTLQDVGEHIDWVQSGSEWDLIAAHDGTKKIKRKASNTAVNMGNYPGGVNVIQAITATPVAGQPMKLKIFVIHGSWPNIVLRAGIHDRAVQPYSITWEATTVSAGPYSSGLAYGQDGSNVNRVFRILNYTVSRFHWYDVTTPSVTGYETGLAPYTDHAYLHPEGEYDKFAPVGFDQNSIDGYFYGIDQYVHHVTGRAAWVVARFSKANLRP
ncbi:MAG: hypothetical protein ACOY0T_38670 [Myxococcota bacterium]